ncbi:hypothetical protein NLU13_1781 [Sarocladium strictum]|uniref:GH84 domain-containing protein n=1 Tax=Sarocladium strictum TaxID=5046 RepID=A0AA39LCP3_SARSR|nr:hypothetical protein NLU13_1781 [Sarocladium strictum]
MSSSRHRVQLNRQVTVVRGNFSDEPTLKLIQGIVSSAGGQVTAVSSSAKGRGTQIVVGTSKDNSAAAVAAEKLTGESADGLGPEGYALAVGKHDGRPTIVLNGVDARAQSLRQLAQERRGVQGVEIRDWPLMAVRGSVEGFYGIPWSHQARLDHFAFYGKHKINTYIYTPKDDVLLRRRWRELYEGSHLEEIQELVNTANANHVEFTFALSPGNDLCYSSDEDFEATVNKFSQIRDLGVRRFYLALDDIPTDAFHCDADERKWHFTDDWLPLAEAQTFYLNRLQKEFVEKNNLEDLETVPTSYIGSRPTPYKERFGSTLDKKVRIQWTGEDTMSPNITSESAMRASQSYVTDNLFVWDNFPVNDMAFDRLFLNPMTERASDLYKHLLGFTSNPMQQPYASMPALINYADYTWNTAEYDATKSTRGALEELAGPSTAVRDALVAFVDLNQHWPYRQPEIFAPQLSKDVQAFWDSRQSKSWTPRQRGTQPLLKRLDLLSRLPHTLSRMEERKFAPDVKPWTTAAVQWAEACRDLISMLDLLDRGEEELAGERLESARQWVEKTKEKTVHTLDRDGNPDAYAPKIGDGVFEQFLKNATAIYERGRGGGMNDES